MIALAASTLLGIALVVGLALAAHCALKIPTRRTARRP